MELHVLTGRDVSAAARPTLRHLGERDELFRREHALRDLGADHHRTVLALPVHSVDEAECTPRVGRNFAALERFQLLNESIQLAFVREAEPRRTERLWVVHLGHDDISCALRCRQHRGSAPALTRNGCNRG